MASSRPPRSTWFLFLVGVCALSIASTGGAASAAAPTKVAAGPRPNNAYRLPQTPDMPGWARQLYRDDIEVDVHELDREFERWRESEEAARPPGSESDEDGWEKYYRRWRAAVADYVQPDGTLDFSVSHAVAPPVETARATDPSAGTTSVWAPIGPIENRYLINYHPQAEAASYHTNVTAIDVAPSNPNVLFCGTQTGTIGKSTNKGASWINLGWDNPDFRGEISAVAIHTTDPGIVYVGGTAGVSKSVDGGFSWSRDFFDQGLNPNDLEIRPDQPEMVLVAGRELRRRMSSSNWVTALALTTYDVEYKPDDPSVAYALAQVKKVTNPAVDSLCYFFKSTNGGDSFSIRPNGWVIPGLDSVEYRGARMAVTPADPNRIYVVVLTRLGPRILRSNDAGETWFVAAASAYAGFDSPCTDSVFTISNGQGFYDLAISASPLNADQFVVGTTNLQKSADGGATFTQVGGYCYGPGTFKIHPDIQEVRSIGGDSWAATDGGVSLSTDFWTTQAGFSSRNFSLGGSQFLGLGMGWNEDAIVGGRNHNGDGAWHQNYPAGRFLFMGGGESGTGYVNPGNSRMVYFSDAGGHILPETIGGYESPFHVSRWPNESWDHMASSEQEWDPRYMYTYYIGRMDSLLKTTDNGQTFAPVFVAGNPTVKVTKIEVSRGGPNVVHCLVRSGETSALWSGYDDGRFWAPQLAPAFTTPEERKDSDLVVSGTEPYTLWWCFRGGRDGYKVFKSTDGGFSWANKTTPTLNGYRPMALVHQIGTNGGIYLGCEYGKVFYRNDSMADWVAYDSGLPRQLNTEPMRLQIQYKNRKLRMASVVGIWEVDLYEHSTTTVPQPMVDRQESTSPCDTLQLESYSVVNGPATYHWSVSPQPLWISDPSIRNPRVVLGPTTGPYAFTLAVTDDNGTTTRTVDPLVSSSFVPSVQWASSVVGFSSEYDFSFAAAQALGPPDVFPSYGDLAGTWASLTEDGQREFLEIAFADSALTNFVRVVETFNPGALDKVSVRNPSSGLYEEVWSGAAAPAPAVARKLDVAFPQPAFPVRVVRLDFDSPAVPGWNEVDAVGIGRCSCPPGATTDVPVAVRVPITNQIEWVRPNPFTASTDIGFTLAHEVRVQVEVFSVSGQRVTQLVDGMRPAGRHEVRWDGRNATGRAVPNGIYYLRLAAGNSQSSRKIIKIE